MKKLFLLSMFCLLCSLSAMSQTTKVVSGAVIDRHGNPLPGATVQVPQGAESAIVDADGTYSIEVPVWSTSLVAHYAGMKDKKMKIKGDEIIFRMKPLIKSQWFLNVVAQSNFDEYYYGFMVGYLGKWGGYLKVASFLDGSAEDCGSDDYDNNYKYYPAVTVGVTKRICRFLHVYAGAGATPYNAWDYNYCCDDDYDLSADLGFIVKPTEHFNLNVGAYIGGDEDFGLQLGLGYSF